MKYLRTLGQRGSSHIVLILAVVVIAAVGVAGYRVMQTDEPIVTNTTLPPRNTDAPDSIKSSADLKKAEASLDSTANDSSINPNQLDEDINSLL